MIPSAYDSGIFPHTWHGSLLALLLGSLLGTQIPPAAHTCCCCATLHGGKGMKVRYPLSVRWRIHHSSLQGYSHHPEQCCQAQRKIYKQVWVHMATCGWLSWVSPAWPRVLSPRAVTRWQQGEGSWQPQYELDFMSHPIFLSVSHLMAFWTRRWTQITELRTKAPCSILW